MIENGDEVELDDGSIIGIVLEKSKAFTDSVIVRVTKVNPDVTTRTAVGEKCTLSSERIKYVRKICRESFSSPVPVN